MDDGTPEIPDPASQPAPKAPKRRIGSRALTAVAAAFGVFAVMAGVAWFNRETIADRIIVAQLDQYQLPGTYQIESIGLRHQVLRNVVIGNPARPDFTAERVVVEIEPRLGLPTLGRLELDKARVYATVKAGKLSFGALDKVLARQTGPSTGLPDLDLVVRDGRARLDSPFGAAGIKVEGRGNLRSGFSGVLAAVMPKASIASCQLAGTSLFGTLRTAGGAPAFNGPVRVDAMTCPAATIRRAAVQLALRSDPSFARFNGNAAVQTAGIAAAGQRLASSAGTSDFTWDNQRLTASYRLSGTGLAGTMLARNISIDGTLRSRDAFSAIDSEGTLRASAMQPGASLSASLTGAERTAQGTLGAPLLGAFRAGLAREAAASQLELPFIVHRTNSMTSVVVPRGRWRGSSGQDLLAVSQLQAAFRDGAGPLISGNVVTGGAGLPRIVARLERAASGLTSTRLSMAEYRAGDAALALPQAMLAITPRGEIGFSGRLRVSGAIPNGRLDQLELPVDGRWSARGGLTALRRCTPVTFNAISLATLTLDARQLTLCPPNGRAIVMQDARGLRLAAGVPALALTGRLGNSPVRIRSGAVGFAMPGALAARNVMVELGPASNPNRFSLASVQAQLNQTVSGQFAGADIALDAVPLNLMAGTGNWRFDSGALTVSNTTFELHDRETPARFTPLLSRGAQLTLINGIVRAQAELREPASDRLVAETTIMHDLARTRGSAELTVPGLLFDKRVQPDTLTQLARGIIANAEGTITGTGRIDWNGSDVTSTGRFTTDRFDFAAAFGPVDGVSGTVVFDDLLGLVTAPNQRLKIASINPGIEVYDGEASFALQPGHVLQVYGAEWPFIDGTLQLLPTRMVLGASEERRFTMRVTGVSAALFVERLQLGNIAANGYFDGEIPIVFDEEGGWIRGGLLVSRPPGGNISYVGELTYKDLSAMGNFAFQTLRSLDFKRMQIGLDGALDGDIITRLKIDGVRQGASAKKNIITQRFANLPIQFNINIKAPFQRLVTSFKSMYDPTYVRDPRALGLIGASSGSTAAPAAGKVQKAPAQQSIQTSESRNRP